MHILTQWSCHVFQTHARCTATSNRELFSTQRGRVCNSSSCAPSAHKPAHHADVWKPADPIPHPRPCNIVERLRAHARGIWQRRRQRDCSVSRFHPTAGGLAAIFTSSGVGLATMAFRMERSRSCGVRLRASSAETSRSTYQHHTRSLPSLHVHHARHRYMCVMHMDLHNNGSSYRHLFGHQNVQCNVCAFGTWLRTLCSGARRLLQPSSTRDVTSTAQISPGSVTCGRRASTEAQ